MDLPTLHAAIDAPGEHTRALLFAHLANAKAAARARAAEGLLKLYATQPHRGGLARDFGNEPEAILTRVLDELRELIDEPRTDAWTRFVTSMEMTQDVWRDGTGYDLDALQAMSSIERGAMAELITTRLGNRNRTPDWRDLEAAHAFGLTDVLKQLADDPDPLVRIRALELVGADGAVETELCSTLHESRDANVVSRALDRVANYPTADVMNALISRVRRLDANFIYAALVLLEVFADVADTWAERPFLFEVQAEGADGPRMAALLARVKPR
jgi:uncharacterized membrane protein